MAPETDTTASDDLTLDFYWRPGCPFCMRLEKNLDKAGVTLNKRNIWDNPDDAAHVRSVADGNETVPTITMGDVSMVNPPADTVMELVRERAPHLLSADADSGRAGLFGRRRSN